MQRIMDLGLQYWTRVLTQTTLREEPHLILRSKQGTQEQIAPKKRQQIVSEKILPFHSIESLRPIEAEVQRSRAFRTPALVRPTNVRVQTLVPLFHQWNDLEFIS